MRRLWWALVAAPILTVVMGVALAQAQAQEPVTISIAENPDFGRYLTDGEGRTLYLFVEDEGVLATPIRALERVTEGVREEARQCTGECLVNWPPFLADDGSISVASEAQGVLDPELLYVADVDGRQQVVYNGWPLYYFANDTQAGDINGQGVGNRWFAVSPEGQAAGAGEVAGGGAGEPAGEDESDRNGGQDGDTDDESDGGAGGMNGGEMNGGAGDDTDGTTGGESNGGAGGAMNGGAGDTTDGGEGN